MFLSKGITNTIGRLLSGLLVDIFKLNALVINNTALVVSAILLFVEPFCTTYELLVTFAVLYGLCVGKYLINSCNCLLYDLKTFSEYNLGDGNTRNVLRGKESIKF